MTPVVVREPDGPRIVIFDDGATTRRAVLERAIQGLKRELIREQANPGCDSTWEAGSY